MTAFSDIPATTAQVLIDPVNNGNANNNTNNYITHDYITFENDTILHYQTVIAMLRQKSVLYRSFHQNYTSDNMNDDDYNTITTVFNNINELGNICQALADYIEENNGDHECEPNAFCELMFTTFNSSMSVSDLLTMSQQQLDTSSDLF